MSDKKSLLSQILDEVKVAQSTTATSTSHNTYVSGVFEEPAPQVLNCPRSDMHVVETNPDTTKQSG